LAAQCLTEALDGAGPRRAGRIAGVGVSTFWHGLVGADQDARALTPIYLWGDTRSWRASERLRGRLDVEAIRQRTGCPIHSSYWPAKLAWLRRERPELWRGRVRWVSLRDLFFWRLFGRLGTRERMHWAITTRIDHRHVGGDARDARGEVGAACAGGAVALPAGRFADGDRRRPEQRRQLA
jgi:sugar (pentulose or hexulose) kinase